MKNIIGLLSGIIFAIGLVVSGMIDPNKVTGFLDLFGDWDYALAFVMGGAVIFNLVTFKLIKKKESPLFSSEFHWPTKVDVDKKLVLGAIIFGTGWGIAGICPGPGIVNVITLEPKMLVFVGSMSVGMLIFKFLEIIKR